MILEKKSIFTRFLHVYKLKYAFYHEQKKNLLMEYFNIF